MTAEYGIEIASPATGCPDTGLGMLGSPAVPSLDRVGPGRCPPGAVERAGTVVAGRAGAGAGSAFLKSFEKAPNMLLRRVEANHEPEIICPGDFWTQHFTPPRACPTATSCAPNQKRKRKEPKTSAPPDERPKENHGTDHQPVCGCLLIISKQCPDLFRRVRRWAMAARKVICTIRNYLHSAKVASTTS
jgi:hypothetical protein